MNLIGEIFSIRQILKIYLNGYLNIFIKLPADSQQFNLCQLCLELGKQQLVLCFEILFLDFAQFNIVDGADFIHFKCDIYIFLSNFLVHHFKFRNCKVRLVIIVEFIQISFHIKVSFLV